MTTPKHSDPALFAVILRDELLLALRELGYDARIGDFYAIEVVHEDTRKVLGIETVWVSS